MFSQVIASFTSSICDIDGGSSEKSLRFGALRFGTLDGLVSLRVFDEGVKSEVLLGVMTTFDDITGFAEVDGETEVVVVKEFVTVQSVTVTVGAVETFEIVETGDLALT